MSNAIRRLVNALATIHKHGILHGDIHHDNILVKPARNRTKVSIIDFCLSRKILDKGEAQREMMALKMMLDKASLPASLFFFFLSCWHAGSHFALASFFFVFFFVFFAMKHTVEPGNSEVHKSDRSFHYSYYFIIARVKYLCVVETVRPVASV